MVDLVPATPDMAEVLQPQSVQLLNGMPFDKRALRAAISAGWALAVVDGGRPIAIGGLVPIWPGRALAWGVLESGIRATMTPIHRIVERALATTEHHRVEAYVASEHEEGARWARLLGFREEGLMRGFYAGNDFRLFSRLKE